jgi:hypothetical protein
MRRGLILLALWACGDNKPGEDLPDALADLKLTVTAPAESDASAVIVHTVTLMNAGPDPAEDVGLRHDLSGGQVEAIGGVTSCFQSELTEVRCNLDVMTVGQTLTLTVQTRAFVEGTFASLTELFGDTLDPNYLDNTSVAQTIVTGIAELGLQLNGATPSAPPNSTVFYDILIFNNGPTNATNGTLTLTPVNGMIIDQVFSNEWACAGSPVVTCSRGIVATGATFLSMQGITPATGTSCGVDFAISSETMEQFPGDNTLSITTEIIQ